MVTLCGGRKFYVCAGSEPEEPLHAGHIGRRDVRATVETTGALGRLLLHDVAAVGLLADQLAGSGLPEALGGALVGLHLRHDRSSSHGSSRDPVGSRGADAGRPWSGSALRAGRNQSEAGSVTFESCALARVLAPRCGATTIVMLRPSCLAL